MGYSKPGLGFVLHYQPPGSVVHDYHQFVTAGRAVESAYGILFSGKEDDEGIMNIYSLNTGIEYLIQQKLGISLEANYNFGNLPVLEVTFDNGVPIKIFNPELKTLTADLVLSFYF